MHKHSPPRWFADVATRLLAVSSLDTSLMFWRRLALARLLGTISGAAWLWERARVTSPLAKLAACL